MLNEITPLILTFNEAPNIARTLDRLSWARDIVVVDSVSTDDTRAIAARYPSVRVIERAFTTHAEQWNFGLEQTGIKTDWVLALDADFVLTEDVVREIGALSPPEDVDGYRASFTYCIDGTPLRSARLSAGHGAVPADACQLPAGWPHAARPRRRPGVPNCRHASCTTIANRLRTGLRRRSNTCALEAEKLSTAPVVVARPGRSGPPLDRGRAARRCFSTACSCAAASSTAGRVCFTRCSARPRN